MPRQVFGIEQTNLVDRPSYDALKLWRFLANGQAIPVPTTKVDMNFKIKELANTDAGKLRMLQWKLQIKRRQLGSLPRLIARLEDKIRSMGGNPNA